MDDEFSGFGELEDVLNDVIKKTSDEKVLEALEYGARDFANQAKKLPKPKSKINVAGYTHLIETIAHKKDKKEVVVGWGKYYGPMVEKGTTKMSAQPHLYPLWNNERNGIFNTIIKKLNL